MFIAWTETRFPPFSSDCDLRVRWYRKANPHSTVSCISTKLAVLSQSKHLVTYGSNKAGSVCYRTVLLAPCLWFRNLLLCLAKLHCLLMHPLNVPSLMTITSRNELHVLVVCHRSSNMEGVCVSFCNHFKGSASLWSWFILLAVSNQESYTHVWISPSGDLFCSIPLSVSAALLGGLSEWEVLTVTLRRAVFWWRNCLAGCSYKHTYVTNTHIHKVPYLNTPFFSSIFFLTCQRVGMALIVFLLTLSPARETSNTGTVAQTNLYR